MKKFLLAREIEFEPIGGEPGEGFGPWGNLGQYTQVGEAAKAFTQIISNIIGVMTIIAGLWFIFQFIIGAYGFLTAGGNQEAVKTASKKIANAIIGLTIVVAAYALIFLIGKLLGFEILQPQKFIEMMKPGGKE